MRKLFTSIWLGILSLLLVMCQREVTNDVVNRTQSGEFINYTLDGINHDLVADSISNLSGFVSSSPPYDATSQISGYRFGTVDRLVIFFLHKEGITSGTFPLRNIHVQQFRSKYPQTYYPLIHMDSIPLSVGGFYQGSISGQFSDTSSVLHNISGSFRVKRRV